MTNLGRGVWFGVIVTLALLLPACAPRKEPRVQPWSYVKTKLPAWWWYDRVDVRGARDAARTTGAGQRIAIVDTGVRTGHEDIAFVLPGVATCGNPADTDDRNGHGTQLAGIALGRDPGRATQGVAPDASLIPIKVECGVVTPAALTEGIDRAIQRKPDVVLLALGGYPGGAPDVHAFLEDRLRRNPDILFVVASVWDGSAHPFPAWARLDNALVVAGMTLDDNADEVPFSAKRGDLWAPGRNIETADIPDPARPQYAKYLMQGASPASAIVAGCAALVKQRTGHTGRQLKQALVAAAEPQPKLDGPSSRRLQCEKAVR